MFFTIEMHSRWDPRLSLVLAGIRVDRFTTTMASSRVSSKVQIKKIRWVHH
uniref:Uncharacterized protein n=1 Tax=Helianthus annuus TaxID=4232 RepID=A0A251TV21_HELAN